MTDLLNEKYGHDTNTLRLEYVNYLAGIDRRGGFPLWVGYGALCLGVAMLNPFVHDLDHVSVRGSVGNHTFQAGNFEQHLRKGLLTCGYAVMEPIRDSAESHHWPHGLGVGGRSFLGTSMKPE